MKKKMKSIAAFLLLPAMLVSLMSGCGPRITVMEDGTPGTPGTGGGQQADTAGGQPGLCKRHRAAHGDRL